MRLLHYPPQTGPVDDRVQGIGAHTEYVHQSFRAPHALTATPDSQAMRSAPPSFAPVEAADGRLDQCFTILWQQDDVRALQVLNANGKWVDAVPIPGTLVVKYVPQFIAAHLRLKVRSLGDQFARWTSEWILHSTSRTA